LQAKVCLAKLIPRAIARVPPSDYSEIVVPHAQTVITLRSEVRGPLVTAVGQPAWPVALALGGAVGSALILAFALWPRRGELVRRVIDGQRRTLYWAHHGHEPEELPFSALRAVAVEHTHGPYFGRLWAVDLSGRWVVLGSGSQKSIEGFAGELSESVDVPVWHKTEEYAGSQIAGPQEVLPGGQPEER
jgi:hypothetical protein